MLWVSQDRLDEAVAAVHRALWSCRQADGLLVLSPSMVHNEQVEPQILAAMSAITRSPVVPAGTVVLKGFSDV